MSSKNSFCIFDVYIKLNFRTTSSFSVSDLSIFGDRGEINKKKTFFKYLYHLKVTIILVYTNVEH